MWLLGKSKSRPMHWTNRNVSVFFYCAVAGQWQRWGTGFREFNREWFERDDGRSNSFTEKWTLISHNKTKNTLMKDASNFLMTCSNMKHSNQKVVSHINFFLPFEIKWQNFYGDQQLITCICPKHWKKTEPRLQQTSIESDLKKNKHTHEKVSYSPLKVWLSFNFLKNNFDKVSDLQKNYKNSKKIPA